MASKQKTKGSNFEREVARLLTDLFKVGTFTKTQGSGSYFGGKNQARLNSTENANSTIKLLRGDIIPPDYINLVVECKCHNDFGSSFKGIISGTNSKLTSWLKEVHYDSNYNEIPNMLIFKITDNSGLIYFALPTKHFRHSIFENTPRALFYLDNPHTEYLIVEYKNIIPLSIRLLEVIQDDLN